MTGVRLRRLAEADLPAVHEANNAAFADFDVRRGRAPEPPPAWEVAAIRLRHLLATDPDGCWVAERDGRIAGVAMALLREGIWGLSLLSVHPEAQALGLGRALFERALAYGAGARGGIILASEDPRAIALYARAGFALRPAVDAGGAVRRRPAWPAAVRLGTVSDLRATEPIDRLVRGAARAHDLGALLAAGRQLLIADGRGYAVVEEGPQTRVVTLAALEEATATGLVEAALSLAQDAAAIWFITAGHDWAVRAALDAGLALTPTGPVLVRGDVGTFAPYLPCGPYL